MSDLNHLMSMSQMEVGRSRIWRLKLTTQTQVGGTPHKPALPATQPRAPPTTPDPKSSTCHTEQWVQRLFKLQKYSYASITTILFLDQGIPIAGPCELWITFNSTSVPPFFKAATCQTRWQPLTTASLQHAQGTVLNEASNTVSQLFQQFTGRDEPAC